MYITGEELLKRVAGKGDFSKASPDVVEFLKGYVTHEKAVEHQGKLILNTHFPPYPGAAFDSWVESLGLLAQPSRRRLYAITLAVTNRCQWRCWHCYNAGRSQEDVPLSVWRETAAVASLP